MVNSPKDSTLRNFAINKIVTNLAVIEITDGGFKLLERAPGISVEEIVSSTDGRLIIDGDIPEMIID